MAKGKAHKTPNDKPIPTSRAVDANGLDSIFAGGRNPTAAELNAYWRYMGSLPSNGHFVEMLGTAFQTQADARAYWQYMQRVRGDSAASSTPDP